MGDQQRVVGSVCSSPTAARAKSALSLPAKENNIKAYLAPQHCYTPRELGKGSGQHVKVQCSAMNRTDIVQSRSNNKTQKTVDAVGNKKKKSGNKGEMERGSKKKSKKKKI